ncbi:ferritin-like domain-containing protein [Deinococcus radiotolerans]|uniref:Ferritin-like domain-containing protein n=1 Tax=Deinococcus radiotolerans TaxID=1309407 RepID=A0ABQ2FG13_9DEIO|nr:ferritin-like domain-containing protein [Deinococcus radiotolerans]GGK87754.1 hypothetical protein GCM10010844_02860 [Deinococcus radiotolerans]
MSNRRSFLKFAGAGAGAVTLGALDLSALAATSPSTKSRAQDIAILNYALTLEYLEAEFYTTFDSGALASKLTNTRVKEYARELAAHEQAHVEALKATITALGDKPVAKPTFDFSTLIGDGSSQNDQTFLALAATLEPVGVRAYLGQADRVQNADVLTAAASILAVEANHASGIQELRTQLGFNTKPTRQTSIAPQSDAKPTSTSVADFDGDFSPTPTAFWKPLSMEETLLIVKPLIK